MCSVCATYIDIFMSDTVHGFAFVSFIHVRLDNCDSHVNVVLIVKNSFSCRLNIIMIMACEL